MIRLADPIAPILFGGICPAVVGAPGHRDGNLVVPRLSRDQVGNAYVSAFELADGRVDESVFLRLTEDRLRVEQHDPDLPGLEMTTPL